MPYYQFSNSNKGHINFICDRLKDSIYTKISNLKIEAYVTKEPATFKNKTSGEFKNLSIGDQWGELWDCGWFHMTGEIDKFYLGKKLTLLVDLNGEACVYDKNGSPVKGLTTFNSRMCPTLGSVGKKIYDLPEEMLLSGKVDLWIDAGCNDLFEGKKGIVNEAAIGIKNEKLRELYYDFAVLNNLLEVLNCNSARYVKILDALSKVTLLMRDYSENEAVEALKILKPLISMEAGDSDFYVTAIGHAHLDLGWTWPLRETIRKATRTFSTVLYHMERYQDYYFGASQIQLYAWMEERYPQLFEKIKQRIDEGRWEVQGGMWCESDVNVIGGESLVRQFLYGKRYSINKLGKDVKVCWLPDTFGYTAALPQILKKSGMKYICIQKIRTFADYFKYPHDSFLWEGIDGTEVLVHVPPLLYSSAATPSEIYKTEYEYKDKLTTNSALLLFGQGDGGGGAGAEHLECLERVKSLNGLVPAKQGTAEAFFKELEQSTGKLKTWTGSLDLDKHTGTLTSSSKSKYYNSKIENELRKTELLAVMAYLKNGTAYPYEQFESIWRNVLLYQFHDILPGTSIQRVYNESFAHYEQMLSELNELSNMLKDKIAEDRDTFVYNSTQFKRKEWVKISDKWLFANIDPFTCTKPVNVKYEAPVANEALLENDVLRITFNNKGWITSIWDKQENREVITDQSNRLFVYIDRLDNGNDPWCTSSAWDLAENYMDKTPEFFKLVKVEPMVDGPRASILIEYKYNKSTLVQEIVLMQGSRCIDFVTKCDWNESGKMLRTNFFVDITSNEMTRGIQFGNIKEPLNNNTEWQQFKMEVCGQKYVDLSDNDYGVALLTDYKYGFNRAKGELNLNLLRSPEYPAVDLDMGIHEFTYSLYPHKGNEIDSDVVAKSYIKNNPLEVVDQGFNSSLFKIENAIIESIKLAEDDDSIILRIYEPYGNYNSVKLITDFTIKSCYLADLMENNINVLDVKDNLIDFKISPFEITTLKIQRS